MTTAELTWSLKDDADSYVVEFSEDSLLFNSIVKTINVAPDEVPFSYTLEGQTLYSVRVKGISASGIGESKWTQTAFRTDAENIFYPVDPEDVTGNSAILKWPAASEVTNFIINPGNIDRQITPLEIEAGEATLTGLTGETTYTVISMLRVLCREDQPLAEQNSMSRVITQIWIPGLQMLQMAILLLQIKH